MTQDKPKKDVGLLKRLANSAVRGTIESAEFLSSIPEHLMKPATFILKKFGPKKLKEFLADMEKYESSEGPLSSISKKYGILKELPAPESYKEKVADNAGDIIGSSVVGGALGGYKALKTIPGILGELGGLGAQSLAAPKIQEAMPNNKIGQFAGNILTGLAGNVAGSKVGKSLSKPITPELPSLTHAQTLPIGSPEWRKQTAQELDLAKRDPTTGALRQNIQIKRHKEIAESFPTPRIKPTKIVDNIVNNFKKLKSKLYKEYEEGLDKSFSSMKIPKKYDTKTGKALPTYKQINLDKTNDNIIELIESEPKGKAGERGFLEGILKELEKQRGNSTLLNAFKKRMGKKAKYEPSNTLYMGEAKNSLLKKVIHNLTEDLKEQIPGYRDVMEKAEKKIKYLESLEKGVVGDYVKSAQKNPSEFINKIFENPNEEFVNQFKQIISPELYEQAAQSYLGELKDVAMSKTIRGFENQDARFFALRGKLEDRALQHSLPEKWKEWTQNKAKDIHVSEMGSPRGDIALNANRGIKVGDESKLFGVSKEILGKSIPTLIGGGIGAQIAGVPGAAVGIGLGKITEKVGEKAKTAMLREQMLTGKSPSQQIAGHLETGINKTLPQAVMAERMTEKPELEKELPVNRVPESNNPRLEKFNKYIATLKNSKEKAIPDEKAISAPKRPNIQTFKSFIADLKSRETKGRKLPGDSLKTVPVINPLQNETPFVEVE